MWAFMAWVLNGFRTTWGTQSCVFLVETLTRTKCKFQKVSYKD